MADSDPKQLLEMVSAPLGDLIAEMGRGVAAAQREMDKQTLDNYSEIYRENNEALLSLREMGYRPTWYHIPEADAELQVSLTLGGDYSGSGGNKIKLFASPVNAGFKNSYNYSLEASSKLKFRIVPVPEPASMEQRNFVPAVEGFSLGKARELLERLGVPYSVQPAEGADDAVVKSVSPAAGSILADQQAMIVILDQTNLVPAVKGLSLSEAKTLLDSRGISYSIQPTDGADDAIVKSVSPVAGSALAGGQSVTVVLE